MRKRKNQNEKVIRAINDMQQSSQIIAENTEHINKKLDNIQQNSQITTNNIESANKKLDDMQKAAKSKLPTILTIIALIVSVSGISIWEIYDNYKKNNKENEPYEIYLYSEYGKVTMGVATDITATLNFDSDSVSITAYLASGKTDTLEMQRKNDTEWQKKVYFNETGIHTIVVTAVDPDGNLVEDTIEVEVVSVVMDDVNELLKNLY